MHPDTAFCLQELSHESTQDLVQALLARIDALEASSEHEAQQSAVRISALEQHVSSIASDYSTAQHTLQALESSCAQLEESAAFASAQHGHEGGSQPAQEHQQANAEVSARLAAVEDQVAQLQSAASAHTAFYTSMAEAQPAASRPSASHAEALEAVKSRVRQLEVEVVKVAASVEASEAFASTGDVSTLAEAVHRLQAQLDNSAAPVADAAQISSLADSVHALQSRIGAKAAFATADEVNNLAEAVRAVQSSLQSLDHLVQEHVSSGDTHEADTASKLQQVHASVGSLQQAMTELQEQTRRAQAEREQLQSSMQNMQRQVNAAAAESADVREQQAQQASDLAAHAQQLALQQHLQELHAAGTVADRSTRSQDDMQGLSEQVQQLQAMLSTLAESKDTTSSSKQDVSAAVTSAVKHLQQDLHDVVQQSKAQQSEVTAEIQEDVAELALKMEELSQRSDGRLAEATAQSAARIDAIRTDLQSCKTGLAALQDNVQACHDAAISMEAKSWLQNRMQAAEAEQSDASARSSPRAQPAEHDAVAKLQKQLGTLEDQVASVHAELRSFVADSSDAQDSSSGAMTGLREQLQRLSATVAGINSGNSPDHLKASADQEQRSMTDDTLTTLAERVQALESALADVSDSTDAAQRQQAGGAVAAQIGALQEMLLATKQEVADVRAIADDAAAQANAAATASTKQSVDASPGGSVLSSRAGGDDAMQELAVAVNRIKDDMAGQSDLLTALEEVCQELEHKQACMPDLQRTAERLSQVDAVAIQAQEDAAVAKELSEATQMELTSFGGVFDELRTAQTQQQQALESTAEQLTDRINAAEGSVQTRSDDVSELSARVEALQLEIRSLSPSRQGRNSLRAGADVDAFASLSTQVQELSADVQSLQQSDGTATGLAAQLASLQQQVQHLREPAQHSGGSGHLATDEHGSDAHTLEVCRVSCANLVSMMCVRDRAVSSNICHAVLHRLRVRSSRCHLCMQCCIRI